ncbi:MAG: DUF4293 domain-containing protein [Paludibacteraceae bacterium]|jgi:hypothetical protein|nr:DUF4293 domain-containing protein [Paludibacteraceae bacterium]MBP5641641.1 DUF4293 domain-containing protein [Paludibacteraceae bacterium]MBQ4390579.1 DUF4293 domain-containing protein [Paludibacteraceae bacterium]
MIQRIQTIYLMLIVALGILLYFAPVITLSTPADVAMQRLYEVGADGIDELTPGIDETLMGEPIELKGLWGLTLTTLLIPLLALIDIFLYKKRLLQARFNIFLALLCLGYYGILFIYVWFAKMNFGLEWHITFWTCIPLICFVLTMGAIRRILKDEALVRAADRIR